MFQIVCTLSKLFCFFSERQTEWLFSVTYIYTFSEEKASVNKDKHQYPELMFNNCVNIAAQHCGLLLNAAPLNQLRSNAGKINKRYIMARRGTGSSTVFVQTTVDCKPRSALDSHSKP